MTKKEKEPEYRIYISERAMLARFKRKLKREYGEYLRKTRDTIGVDDLGPYFTVDINNNVQTSRQYFADIVKWAREEGCLKPYEGVKVD